MRGAAALLVGRGVGMVQGYAAHLPSPRHSLPCARHCLTRGTHATPARPNRRPAPHRPRITTGLFEKREQRIREERDAARADAATAAEAAAAAEARAAEAAVRHDRLARELEHARGQLEDAAVQLTEARRAAAEAGEAAAARGAEAARLAARVGEVEGEMRALLEAVERQKASSVVKMRQLASLLQDL